MLQLLLPKPQLLPPPLPPPLQPRLPRPLLPSLLQPHLHQPHLHLRLPHLQLPQHQLTSSTLRRPSRVRHRLVAVVVLGYGRGRDLLDRWQSWNELWPAYEKSWPRRRRQRRQHRRQQVGDRRRRRRRTEPLLTWLPSCWRVGSWWIGSRQSWSDYGRSLRPVGHVVRLSPSTLIDHTGRRHHVAVLPRRGRGPRGAARPAPRPRVVARGPVQVRQRRPPCSPHRQLHHPLVASVLA